MKKLSFILAILILFGLLLSNSTDTNELKFSHNYHVFEEEIDCITCHESAQVSSSGLDNLLPSMDICADCHDIEDKENCNICHSDVDNPRIVSRIDLYRIKFPHKRHFEQGFDCKKCHEEVIHLTTVEPYILPKLSFCIECHRNKGVSTECSLCHLPEENIIPISHTLDYKHNHSDLAETEDPSILEDRQCSTCHPSTFCQECHEGDNLDRQSHPLNYQFTHSLEAQGKEIECSTCHTERSFCIECHRDNNVLPHNHTPGWVNQIFRDGGRHRIEAELDLESCMVCHEQNADQVCQPCHNNN